MRKSSFNALVLLFLICFSSFQEKTHKTPYTKSQIESFITEVFAAQADQLVGNHATGRRQLIENFLERFTIELQPQNAQKSFPLLSSVTLRNKYNPNLRRDASFDPSTFNPLKYNFPLASKNKEIFRVDSTNYLIIIEPVK